MRVHHNTESIPQGRKSLYCCTCLLFFSLSLSLSLLARHTHLVPLLFGMAQAATGAVRTVVAVPEEGGDTKNQ